MDIIAKTNFSQGQDKSEDGLTQITVVLCYWHVYSSLMLYEKLQQTYYSVCKVIKCVTKSNITMTVKHNHTVVSHPRLMLTTSYIVHKGIILIKGNHNYMSWHSMGSSTCCCTAERVDWQAIATSTIYCY